MNNHTHKYAKVRVGVKKRVLFRCIIPACTHHIDPALAVGRLSICNSCGNEFILTRYNIKKHAFPKCIACLDSKKREKIEKIIELIGAN